MKKRRKKKIDPMKKMFEQIHLCKDDYKRVNYHDHGYVQIKCPDHPFSAKNGTVQEHRFVMERKIGRFLTPEEEVHHNDHDRQNNDPENLVLCVSKSEHMRKFHSKQFDSVLISQIKKLSQNHSLSRSDIAERLGTTERLVKTVVLNQGIKWIARDEHILDESDVQDLLKKNSTEKVSKILDVHPSTLQRRFPKLFQSGKPRNFLESHKEEILALKAQGLPNVKIGEKFDTNKNTILRYLQKWNGTLPNKGSSAKPQGFLDVHQKEIEKLLLSGISQLQIAQNFETSRTTLSVAIRRRQNRVY